MANSTTFVSEGDIEPSRFVTAGTNDFAVKQANVGDRPMGISQEGQFAPPGETTTYTGTETTKAAAAGQLLRVYGVGEECYLLSGAAVTYGDFLKSDSTGRGVTWDSTSTLQYPGARALQAAAGAGTLIRVQVVLSAGNRGST